MSVEPTTENRRTDPNYKVDYSSAVEISITTLCSMKCPKCSLAMPLMARNKTARNLTLDEVDTFIPHFQGLKQIIITGGEPTVHPQFSEIVRRIWHGCIPKVYTLETNGFKVVQYLPVIAHFFDKVFITQYLQDRIYDKSPDNQKIIKIAREALGDKLIIEPPVDHTIAHGENTSTKMCSKAIDPGLPAGYFQGKMYRCCVEPGIEQLLQINLGVPFGPKWKEKLSEIQPDCKHCLYAGS
jgi:organic radical activating enzyme